MQLVDRGGLRVLREVAAISLTLPGFEGLRSILLDLLLKVFSAGP